MNHNQANMTYNVNDKGYYGNFGGAYIPEMLYPNVEELRENYLRIILSDEFQKEFHDLLENYAGRPTPLYFASRLSERYAARIYLKSEELKKQLIEKEGNPFPDHVIACVGGGSNAAGAFYHYLDASHVNLIGVEAAGKGIDSGESAATTALGKPGVLHGSKTLLMQTEDGQVIEPYSISAGLDYPGIGPMHAHLFDVGRVKFINVTDDEAMN